MFIFSYLHFFVSFAAIRFRELNPNVMTTLGITHSIFDTSVESTIESDVMNETMLEEPQPCRVHGPNHLRVTTLVVGTENPYIRHQIQMYHSSTTQQDLEERHQHYTHHTHAHGRERSIIASFHFYCFYRGKEISSGEQVCLRIHLSKLFETRNYLKTCNRFFFSIAMGNCTLAIFVTQCFYFCRRFRCIGVYTTHCM